MAGFQSLELKPEFGRSLAISVALHAVLIGWLSEPSLPEGKVPVLEGRLSRPKPIEAPTAAFQRPAPAAATVPSPVVEDRVSEPSPSADAPPADRAPAAVDEAADEDGLREYRLGIAVAARQLKRYPEQARQSGWSGVAEVRVGVDGNGHPLAPRLVRSSGHAALDAAAIGMLEGAAARTPTPLALRGRPFSVVLPVIFGLEGE